MKINPLTFGDIRYFPSVDGDDRPAYFEVSFIIGCTQDPEKIPVGNTFSFSVGVPTETGDRSYSEVEDAGARQLPAALRALAEAVELDLERSAQERAQKEEGKSP